MESTPRVSILLPVFDSERTLDVCLRSLLRQREERWECIIIDDGSRDRTRAIALDFARRDPRMRVVCQPHRGIVAALNAGLEHCRAPHVARMDGDDWMHRDRLQLQLEYLETNPKLDAVGSHVRMFPRAGLLPGRLAYERWLNSIETPRVLRRESFVECPIAHPTLMIRTPTLEAYGYRDCGWPEDYDLVLRLLADGHDIGVVPRRLLGWRDDPERLSRTGAAYEIEQFVACKAAHLAATFLLDRREYILWGYGHTGRALRKALVHHGLRPARIVELHPGRLGQTIHGARVIPPSELPGVDRHPIVVSVSGAQPRKRIRRALSEMQFRDGLDYVCTA